MIGLWRPAVKPRSQACRPQSLVAGNWRGQ